MLKEIVTPIAAILTPFTDSGQVDFPVLGAYLGYLEERGIQSIITNGTTAEFFSLTFDERKKLLEYCRANFEGTIINHVSATSVADIRKLLQHSREYSDYALVLPPYYYANIQREGVVDFFDAVLASADIPTFLYNFPRHTQFNLSLDLIEFLAERHRNLVGLKDSSGDLGYATSCTAIREPFSVYVGNDRISLSVLQSGLAGSVTGAGSAFPECLVAIRHYHTQGDDQIAQKIQDAFNEWNVWRKEIGIDEIALTKQALALRLNGYPVRTRPPLSSISPDDSKLIESKVLYFRKKFDELLSA